ncbi:hypothetical protein VNO77_22940 [Canavalia gladiata]|uniref:Uncharacterized protein n=1 Tax=Canavalia gladiata TaxID=3824 RepID=A0AAN9L4F4_CANGL
MVKKDSDQEKENLLEIFLPTIIGGRALKGLNEENLENGREMFTVKGSNKRWKGCPWSFGDDQNDDKQKRKWLFL